MCGEEGVNRSTYKIYSGQYVATNKLLHTHVKLNLLKSKKSAELAVFEFVESQINALDEHEQ